jgi:hypothetical protein
MSQLEVTIESKSQATDRLRREGRWDQACTLREEKRLAFRRSGMKRPDAVAAAWKAMIEAFPPLPTAVVEPVETREPDAIDAESLAMLLSRESATTTDLIDEVAWVYDFVGDERVEPRDAPSLGAWSLLGWARDNRSKFYELIWPKAAAARSKRAEIRSGDSAEREQINELSRYIWDQRREWRRELAADAPVVIREQAANILKRLPPYYAAAFANVPPAAVDALAEAMVELTLGYMTSAPEHSEQSLRPQSWRSLPSK